MTTYITFMFWLGLFGFIFRALIIGTSTYPRTQEYSLGFDLAVLLLFLPLLVWVTYLKWFVV